MEEFISYLEAKGIHISEEKVQKFKRYLDMLIEWNEKFNLTAITNPEEIWTKHFLDSLTVLEAIPESAKTAVDIGSGAGFPGLPLAIMRPDIKFTLIDARNKKVGFLNAVIDELNLKNVKAIHTRAEDKEIFGKEKFDVGLARAVAMLPELFDYAKNLLKKDGILIAQKKEGGRAEIEEKHIAKIIPINIPSLPPREIVVMKINV